MGASAATNAVPNPPRCTHEDIDAAWVTAQHWGRTDEKGVTYHLVVYKQRFAKYYEVEWEGGKPKITYSPEEDLYFARQKLTRRFLLDAGYKFMGKSEYNLISRSMSR